MKHNEALLGTMEHNWGIIGKILKHWLKVYSNRQFEKNNKPRPTYIPHLQLTKISTPFQQEFTINNNSRISQQHIWNIIIIAVIVLYFWNYNILLDLQLIFGFNMVFSNNVVLLKLCCI